MAKKQAQFRFEEDFYNQVSKLAAQEGVTTSEVVRSALAVYITLHKRIKQEGGKLFIEYDNDSQQKCEVILPWIQSL